MICPNCGKEARFIIITSVDEDPVFGNKHIFRCDDCCLKFEITIDNPKEIKEHY